MQTCPNPNAAHASAAPVPWAMPISKAVPTSGLSRSAIYRAAAAGHVKLIKCGRSTLVDMASVRAFLDALPTMTPKG